MVLHIFTKIVDVNNTVKFRLGALPLRCSLGLGVSSRPQRFYAALQLVHAGLVKRITTLWFYIGGAQNNAPITQFSGKLIQQCQSNAALCGAKTRYF